MMQSLDAITIATLNLLDDLAQWDRRSTLVLEGFQRLRPHVIALQEVSPEPSNARWLADRLGGYSVHLCPAAAHRASDNLALLSRLPTSDHQILALGHEGRQAQRLVVQHQEHTWTIVNTHLYWNPLREGVRVEQAGRLLEWLTPRGPIVVCGDFNARPNARSQVLLKTRFVSAYRAAHGRDPSYTFPTPLRRQPGIRHRARDCFFRGGGWVRHRRNVVWGQTVDHIFVDEETAVESCDLVFDQASPLDESLYASDHLGLFAVLRRATPAVGDPAGAAAGAAEGGRAQAQCRAAAAGAG